MADAIDEFEFFLDKQWSDGLPVVTPTEERVARMLAATKRDPDELIGRIPPMMEPATVRTVAGSCIGGMRPISSSGSRFVAFNIRATRSSVGVTTGRPSDHCLLRKN